MYISGFENIKDVIAQFEAPEDALEGAYLLYAKYRHESYEGSAFILYAKDNKLFEVNGSHCSCYGFEGQWKPEETSKEALEFRFFQGDGRMPYACENDDDVDALRKAVLGYIFEENFLLN